MACRTSFVSTGAQSRRHPFEGRPRERVVTSSADGRHTRTRDFRPAHLPPLAGAKLALQFPQPEQATAGFLHLAKRQLDGLTSAARGKPPVAGGFCQSDLKRGPVVMDMIVTAIPALLAAAFVWKLSQLYPSGGGNHPGVGGEFETGDSSTSSDSSSGSDSGGGGDS